MFLSLAYYRRSAIVPDPYGLAISLAPNLRRDRVSYVGTLRQPLRFREAVSALHDVVVGDFRYQPKDRRGYQAYRTEVNQREAALRQAVGQGVRAELLRETRAEIPPDLEQRYQKLRKVYWNARDKYS